MLDHVCISYVFFSLFLYSVGFFIVVCFFSCLFSKEEREKECRVGGWEDGKICEELREGKP